ncbi:uncharacterized protein E0L32_007220 [Thyridium curvatum]|uniref:Deacetylase sirtuin-type domain-containing protein n=1 Tax=Thyridium curvatum TaxID=1093900 RepID=A0A507AMY7_9PEZI|nr:uncharacterized protein E0L32_007220 [Thyridium curvatum]TPX12105.1 hypothetical protein E0L32_007220 [Thyridium curvatum]
MSKPLMRIPYTEVFPPPHIIPSSAKTFDGAVDALKEFLTHPSPRGLPASTVLLSGAGLSVASGLADYRGVNGTYRVNKTYRPIWYHEFVTRHEHRKRYWARSFLGWTTLQKGHPNAGHLAIRDLGKLGLVSSVITQNVDSFHPRAHPDVPTLELHGYLRSTVCTSCRHEFPRDVFQDELARLNPEWAALLARAVASGALESENPDERRAKGIRTNPDGDVDVPNAPYTTFRYPPCPRCLAEPPVLADGTRGVVEVDAEGAWKPPSNAGILKPSVVMFGESIADHVKRSAEAAIDDAGKLLIAATSLATYSAWRIAKRAKDRGMPVAILNIGGVRGEDVFFAGLDPLQKGSQGVRAEMPTEKLLPAVVEELRRGSSNDSTIRDIATPLERDGSAMFKDLLS